MSSFPGRKGLQTSFKPQTSIYTTTVPSPHSLKERIPLVTEVQSMTTAKRRVAYTGTARDLRASALGGELLLWVTELWTVERPHERFHVSKLTSRELHARRISVLFARVCFLCCRYLQARGNRRQLRCTVSWPEARRAVGTRATWSANER